MSEKLKSAIAHIETLTLENFKLAVLLNRRDKEVEELKEEIESLNYQLLEEDGDD